VAGGGNDPDVAKEIVDADVNTYITGVTQKNSNWEPSLKFHKICEQNGINIVGATHCSTEKFACIAAQKFFEKLGLPTEFVDGVSVMAYRDYQRIKRQMKLAEEEENRDLFAEIFGN
jgi:hypothetical protein